MRCVALFLVSCRPLEGNLHKVATENPDSTLALSTKMAFNSARVSFGGPVNQAEYEVLHSYGEVNGAETVAPGVFIGGCDELMQEVRRNNMSPNKALFCKGHAAWVPGQLEREISKGVWYICAASPDLILRYAGAPIEQGDIKDDLWSDVLTCMGGDYVHIAGKYASPGGDMRLKP
jgi:putative transcriptional regulator